jgi:hypothetical protein
MVLFLSAGCQSSTSSLKPTVQITRVPIANPGGPIQMDFIEGRTTNAKPGQHIVVYARSGIWWVQPFGSQPYTNIQPDSTWKNFTHLGTEYAAILADPGYYAPTKIAKLPAEDNGVVSVATAVGRPAAAVDSKVIHFSGYDWTVRAAGSDRGGHPNSYDSANAWTDKNGFLHLQMAERNGDLTCAEVSLTRSLGYGSYIFVVQDTSHLSPSAVLGMYTVDDFRTDDVRSELDVEVSRWGLAESRPRFFQDIPWFGGRTRSIDLE